MASQKSDKLKRLYCLRGHTLLTVHNFFNILDLNKLVILRFFTSIVLKFAQAVEYVLIVRVRKNGSSR